MSSKWSIIDLNVNGIVHSVRIKDNWTLLKVLRDELNLTGSKCGCDKGQCGACTVLMDGKPILSCLTLAIAVEGQEIVTIEGLGRLGYLHPLQESFVGSHAFQCGFCAPGMVLTAKALLDEEDTPDEEEIRYYLRGNLCRCGAHPHIIDAVKNAAEKIAKRRK
ncbi:(2Fe-2S)-binding protein [Chloroflexota bacterium]